MKRQNFHPSSSANARSRVPRPPLPFNLPSLSKEAGTSQAIGGIAATGAKWASNRPVGPDLPRHPDSRDESSPAPKAAWGGAGLRQTRPSSEFPHLSKPSSPTPGSVKASDSLANISPDKPPNYESHSPSFPSSSANSAERSHSFYPTSNADLAFQPTEHSEDSAGNDIEPVQSSSPAQPKEEESVIAAKIEFPIDDVDDDEDWADSSQQMDFLPLPVPMTDISLSPSSQLDTSTDDFNASTATESKPTSTRSTTMFPPAISPGPDVNSSASTLHLPHLSLPHTPHSVSARQSTADPTSLIRPSPMFPDRRGPAVSVARPSPPEGVDLKLIEEQKAIMKSKAELAHEARKRAEEERQRDLKERSARKLRELEERLRLKEEEAVAQEKAGPRSIISPSTQAANEPTLAPPVGKARDPSTSNSLVNPHYALATHLPPRHSTPNNPSHTIHRQSPSDSVAYRNHHSHPPAGRRPRTLPPQRPLHGEGRHVRNVFRENPHNHSRTKARRHHDYDGPVENETREQWLDRRRKETETKYAVRSIIDLLITRAINGGHAAPKHLQHRRNLPSSAYPLRRDQPRLSSSAARRPPGHDTHPHDKRRPPIRREMGPASHSSTSMSLRPPSNVTASQPSMSSMTSISSAVAPVPSSEPSSLALSSSISHSGTDTSERKIYTQDGGRGHNNSVKSAVLPPSATSQGAAPSQPASIFTGSTYVSAGDMVAPIENQTDNNALLKPRISQSRDVLGSSHLETNVRPLSGKDAPPEEGAGAARWVASPPVRLAPWAPKASERHFQTTRMSPMAEQRAQEAAEAAQRSKGPRVEASSMPSVLAEPSSNYSSESDPIVALPRPPAYLMSTETADVPSIPVHSVLPGSSQAVAQSISTKVDRNTARKTGAGNTAADDTKEACPKPPGNSSSDRAVDLPPQPEGNVKVLVNPKARHGSVPGSAKSSGHGNAVAKSRYPRQSSTNERRGRGAPHPRRFAGKHEQGRRERKERLPKKDRSNTSDQGTRNDEELHESSSFNPRVSTSKPSPHEEEESKAWANAHKGPNPLASFDEIKRAFSNQPMPYPLAVPPMIPAVPVVTEFKSTNKSDLTDAYREEADKWDDSNSWSDSKKDFHEVRAKILKLMEKASGSQGSVEKAPLPKSSQNEVKKGSDDLLYQSGRTQHRHTASGDSQSSDANSSFEKARRSSRGNKHGWGFPSNSNCYESSSRDELHKLLSGHGSSSGDPVRRNCANNQNRSSSSRFDSVSVTNVSVQGNETSNTDMNLEETMNGKEDHKKNTLDFSAPTTSSGSVGLSADRHSKAPPGSRGRIRRPGPGRAAHRDVGRISNHHRGPRNASRTEAVIDQSLTQESDIRDPIQPLVPQPEDLSQSVSGRGGAEVGSNSRRDRGKRIRENIGNGRKPGQRGRPGFDKGQGRGASIRRGVMVDGNKETAPGTESSNVTTLQSALPENVIIEDSVEISKEDDDGRINVVLNSGRGRDGRGGRRRGFGGRVRSRGSRGRGRGGGTRLQGREADTPGVHPTISQSGS